MTQRIIITMILILSYVQTQPSTAIENGSDASGSGFVVPIKVELRDGTFGGCSGALIAPSIVATAGHCVLDEAGLLTNKIFVGNPGSLNSQVSRSQLVASVQITSGFQNGSNNRAGSDDIVFLVLQDKKIFDSRIRLASEAEVQAIRSKAGKLRVYGYGYVSDGGEVSDTPRTTEGTFSSTILAAPDAAVILPISNEVCRGDSGGPVLSISATEILVIGVISRGNLRNNCGRNGASFTLVSRYTNLAFSAALAQIEHLDKVQEKEKNDSKILYQEIIQELNNRISDLEIEIEELREKIPKTISCNKNKMIKKVTAIKPKCPKGFKKIA